MGIERALESVTMCKGLPYTGPKQIYRALEEWGIAPHIWTEERPKQTVAKIKRR